MKTYRVGCWETIGGYVDIDANTPEEANEKVDKMLEMEGVSGFKNDKDVCFDTTHREYQICDDAKER